MGFFNFNSFILWIRIIIKAILMKIHVKGIWRRKKKKVNRSEMGFEIQPHYAPKVEIKVKCNDNDYILIFFETDDVKYHPLFLIY